MHDAVVLVFIRAVHCVCVMETQLLRELDFVSADSVAAFVVGVLSPLEVLTFNTLLLDGTGVGTGGTFLTGSSVSSGLSALTDATFTAASAAAQQTDVGHAGVGSGGAVTVFSFPAGVTLAEATVTLSMIGAQSAFEAEAVEVVAFAELSPDLTELIGVARTLSTQAVASTAADRAVRFGPAVAFI